MSQYQHEVLSSCNTTVYLSNIIPIPTFGFIYHVTDIRQFVIFYLLYYMHFFHVLIIFIICFLIARLFTQIYRYVLVIGCNYIVILLYIPHFVLNIMFSLFIYTYVFTAHILFTPTLFMILYDIKLFNNVLLLILASNLIQ